MADFEDAMQVAAARACNARHIVTRKLTDYRLSPIPAISPQDAVSALILWSLAGGCSERPRFQALETGVAYLRGT